MATVITYTSSDTFIVPAGVTSVIFECWGWGGTGDEWSVAGGGGAYAKKTLTVTEGTPYYIVFNSGPGVAGVLVGLTNSPDYYPFCRAASGGDGDGSPGEIAGCLGDIKYSGGYADDTFGGGGAGSTGNGGNASGGVGLGTPLGGGDGGINDVEGNACGGGAGFNSWTGGSGKVTITYDSGEPVSTISPFPSFKRS